MTDKCEFQVYIETLIIEKGKNLADEIEVHPDYAAQLEGHFGLTYEVLIEFLCQPAMIQYHGQIRDNLVKIDFMNGNVFHFINHLAAGMVNI